MTKRFSSISFIILVQSSVVIKIAVFLKRGSIFGTSCKRVFVKTDKMQGHVHL